MSVGRSAVAGACAAAILSILAIACAPVAPPPVRKNEPRPPGDADLVALIPAPTESVLSVDVAETSDQINAFLTKFEINGLNVLLDGDAKVSDSYGIFNMPTTFVIDGRGIVRYPKYGAMTVDDLNSYVAALQAE